MVSCRTGSRANATDKANFPDEYDHVWEGARVKVYKGAYFASLLLDAQKQGRIGRVVADPLMQIRCYWDIGGNRSQSGRNGDMGCSVHRARNPR